MRVIDDLNLPAKLVSDIPYQVILRKCIGHGQSDMRKYLWRCRRSKTWMAAVSTVASLDGLQALHEMFLGRWNTYQFNELQRRRAKDTVRLLGGAPDPKHPEYTRA